MNQYLPNTAAASLNMISLIYGRTTKPNNPDLVASYQTIMKVVFVPSMVHDFKRLAGVNSIHALFTDTESYKCLALADRAYLLAFHALVVKALNLTHYVGYSEYENMDDTAVRLATDPALHEKIEHEYFHEHSGLATSSDIAISTECDDSLDYAVNYVVLSPGALITHYEPGNAPLINDMVNTACAQQLAVLRECIKPFNMRHPKESIAMCDPSGTFSAYLALLDVV